MVLNMLNKHAEIWIQLAVIVRGRSLIDLSCTLNQVKSQCPSLRGIGNHDDSH